MQADGTQQTLSANRRCTTNYGRQRLGNRRSTCVNYQPPSLRQLVHQEIVRPSSAKHTHPIALGSKYRNAQMQSVGAHACGGGRDVPAGVHRDKQKTQVHAKHLGAQLVRDSDVGCLLPHGCLAGVGMTQNGNQTGRGYHGCAGTESRCTCMRMLCMGMPWRRRCSEEVGAHADARARGDMDVQVQRVGAHA